jgi:hypothetical protein
MPILVATAEMLGTENSSALLHFTGRQKIEQVDHIQIVVRDRADRDSRPSGSPRDAPAVYSSVARKSIISRLKVSASSMFTI